MFTHPSKQNLLSHRVLPISSSLLTKIHDYGALNQEVEQEYIAAIMGSLFPKSRGYSSNGFLKKLITSASFCQNYVKTLNNNESSLSLRDLHRVKEIFRFYVILLNYKRNYTPDSKNFEDYAKGFVINQTTLTNSIFTRAVIVTLTLNYLFRIALPDRKNDLTHHICKILDQKKYFDLYSFNQILNDQYGLLLERIKVLDKLPRDIAINAPFKENMFAIFVSIYSKTPLFICGKPGSSKSVSVQIIKRSFDGQKQLGKASFLDGMKPLRFEYYQGSDQSTDKGVQNVFARALYHQRKGVKKSVVFIDEIGLAELSPNNPLKVLHKFLDTTSHALHTSKLFSI